MILKKAALISLLLFSISLTHAASNEDVAHLNEVLDHPIFIDMIQGAHPVSTRLAGKRMTLQYSERIKEGRTVVADFVDEKYISFTDTFTGTDIVVKNPYVAFEVGENILYVLWVEPKAVGLPPPGTDLSKYVPVFFGDDQFVAFVMDLESGYITDFYSGPDHNGTMTFLLMQATFTLEDIPD